MTKCHNEEELDHQELRIEFMCGAEVMYNEPYINLQECNNERISIPSECTGFIMTNEKGDNNLHTDKSKRLVGVFTGGYIGTLNEIRRALEEEKRLDQEGITELELEDPDIKEDCCYILYRINNKYSLIPFGENDHVLLRENLEKVVNNIVVSSQRVEGFANNLGKHAKIIIK